MNHRDFGTYCSILHFIDRVSAKLARFEIDEGLWQADEDLRDMIYISIEQIGERAARLNVDQAQADFPNIEWPQIIGLRNILVHDYDSIDASLVWDIVCTDLPKLRSELLANERVRDFYFQNAGLQKENGIVGGLDNSLDTFIEGLPSKSSITQR